MKIHTVIIDDEISGVKSLSILLEKFVPEVKVVASSTDAVESIGIINNYRPDLVFMDIKMPGLDGFEVHERLEYRDFHLIFSTAHKEYAIKALRSNASDYLLKPVDLKELQATVERIANKIRSNVKPDISEIINDMFITKRLRIPLPSKANIEYILPENVLYIEALSNNSVVTLVSGDKETVSSGLKEYESLLCNSQSHFLRIHHSFIINMNYVTRYLKSDGGYVVMQDKKKIPISKNKKDEFLKEINLL